MSREAWYDLPYRESRPVEEVVPIHHHIPFEWGSFQVTEAAQEAYGLVPLNEGQEKGAFDTLEAAEDSPKTHIYLMPPEFRTPTARINGASWSELELRKNGVSVRVGNLHSAEQHVAMVRSMLDSVGDHLPDDFKDFLGLEEALETAKETMDETEDEQLEASARQVILHQLLSSIETDTILGISSWVKGEDSRHSYQSLRKAGAVALGAPITLGAWEIATQNRISVSDASFLGAMALVLGVQLSYSAKKIIQKLNNREGDIAEDSILYSQKVAEDVHSSYCSRHFNWQAEQMLNSNAK